jgi:hypothetical protein
VEHGPQILATLIKLRLLKVLKVMPQGLQVHVDVLSLLQSCGGSESSSNYLTHRICSYQMHMSSETEILKEDIIKP